MRTGIVFILALLLPLPVLGQALPPTYPSYYLAFTPADSIDYGPMYPNQATRDSIGTGYDNAHRRAKAIERYALRQQSTNFLRTVKNSSGRDRWEVALTNGDTTRLTPRVVSRPHADLTFEYYYSDRKLIVFRSQWPEGNGYVLLSRVSGESVRTFGPPVFSPSDKWFVAFNGDAAYSPSGIQVFRRKEEPGREDFDYKEVLTYRMEDAGVSDVRWTSEDAFRLEAYDYRIVRGGDERNFRHYKAEIRRPGR